jgi:hypothetical protein
VKKLGGEAPETTGFGLSQPGVSPFRSLCDDGDPSVTAPSHNHHDVLRRFETVVDEVATSRSSQSQLGVNSSLARLLGNLRRANRAQAQVTDASPAPLPQPQKNPVNLAISGTLPIVSPPVTEAKMSIGLSLAPDAEVRRPGQVARAVVRARAKVKAAEPQISTLDRTEPPPTLPGPPADPFGFVADAHKEISLKYNGCNCKYGNTTLLPDGRVVEVKTAADNTSLSLTKGEAGANTMCVRDRYKRPILEQETKADGTWSFSRLTYDDTSGIKPFPLIKLTVYSDGTVSQFKFSKLGQIETRQVYSQAG